MKKLYEIMNNIELENDYSNPLNNEETERILNIIMQKSKIEMRKNKKHLVRTVIIAAACLTAVLAVSTAFAIHLLNMDNGLSNWLNASEVQKEKLTPALASPDAEISQNGVTVKVLQTLSDTRTLYAVFEVTAPDGVTFLNEPLEYFFEKASFNPTDWEKYAPFRSGIDILEINGSTMKCLASIMGMSTEITDCELSLTLENLLKKRWTESGELLKDENFNPISETVISGKWELKWQYSSNVKTDIKIIEPNAEFTAKSSSISAAQGTYVRAVVKKLSISPLSIAIETAPVNPISNTDNPAAENLTSAAVIINLKNGTRINPNNHDTQINADDSFGHLYYRFENIIDLNDVESVTIGDVTIPVS